MIFLADTGLVPYAHRLAPEIGPALASTWAWILKAAASIIYVPVSSFRTTPQKDAGDSWLLLVGVFTEGQALAKLVIAMSVGGNHSRLTYGFYSF